MSMLKYRKINLFMKKNFFLNIPRETIHRIASTTCVNGVKLLRKSIIGGIPSAGHMTPIIKKKKNIFVFLKIIYLNSIILEIHFQVPLP